MSEAMAAPVRRPVRFSWIALVFAGLFVVGVVIVMVMHRVYVAAERVAARHIPADAVAVVRVDLEKAVLFAPVRRSLLPLLDSHAPGEGAREPRWQRIAARSDLVIGRDTREALAVWGAGRHDWAVVLAGNYPDQALGALAAVFEEEGSPWRRTGERLVSPTGLALAQASDRALVLAASNARLNTTLPSTGEHERLGVPLKGAFSFVGRPRELNWLNEALAPLGDVQQISARADWSSPFVVNIELTYTDSPPAGAEGHVRTVLEQLVGAKEVARLERAVGPAQIERSGKALRIRTRWDHEALERLAERLAARLRAEGASVSG